jgi:2-phosphosulfolactate phosphatase
MKIKTIYSYKNASQAQDLAVVIDVLRAFTTACFVMNNGAEEIIAVASVKEGRRLKKQNPNFILMGEREGVVPLGFNFGNSPAEIEKVNFKNKSIILSTTVGTRAVVGAIGAKEVITGAFVNAQGVIKYIRKRSPKVASLICSSRRGKISEDYLFAQYVKGQLEDKPLDFEKIKKKVERLSIAKEFVFGPQTKYTKGDFYLSLDLNRFNFILKAEKGKDNLIRLVKILV